MATDYFMESGTLVLLWCACGRSRYFPVAEAMPLVTARCWTCKSYLLTQKWQTRAAAKTALSMGADPRTVLLEIYGLARRTS